MSFTPSSLRPWWPALLAGLCCLAAGGTWFADQFEASRLRARASDVPFEIHRRAYRHAEDHDGAFPEAVEGPLIVAFNPQSPWLRPAGAKGGPTPAGTVLAPAAWWMPRPNDYPLPSYVYSVSSDRRDFVCYYVDVRRGQAMVVRVLTPTLEQSAYEPGPPR